MNFLSSPDMAAHYGIPLRTVQAACNSGVIPATKFGRMWMIDPVDAEMFAKQWKPAAASHGVHRPSHTNAIYRCLDAAGGILYIGGTTDMAIKVHDCWWWGQVAEIQVENGYVTPEEMDVARRAAIDMEQPAHNA